MFRKKKRTPEIGTIEGVIVRNADVMIDEIGMMIEEIMIEEMIDEGMIEETIDVKTGGIIGGEMTDEMIDEEIAMMTGIGCFFSFFLD